MSPVEILADHRTKPRNIGKLMNANATGDVGSIVVGDALRFYIQVKDERIAAARFQVFNCQDQVAPSSAITELVVGKSLSEAAALTAKDLCVHLGGLDPYHLPPRLWGLEGLRSAVATYRGEELDSDADLEPLLCRCHGIPADTVRQSIKVMELDTVEAIVAATGAGAGCGSCRADMPALLDEAKAPAAQAAPEPTPRRRSGGRIAMITRIAGAIDGEIAPSLRMAGVEVEPLDLDGSQVVVRISGAVLDDDARRRALEVLERMLKELVDTTLTVREG